jgi:hypothetical protein
MSTPISWDKRLRSPTLRSISQNQLLGAAYFPYEVLGRSISHQLSGMRFDDPMAVLEELANHGRCVVMLPDETHLVLYYVDPDHGRSRIVWYERPPRLTDPASSPRWVVALTLEAAADDEVATTGEQTRDPAVFQGGMR